MSEHRQDDLKREICGKLLFLNDLDSLHQIQSLTQGLISALELIADHASIQDYTGKGDVKTLKNSLRVLSEDQELSGPDNALLACFIYFLQSTNDPEMDANTINVILGSNGKNVANITTTVNSLIRKNQLEKTDRPDTDDKRKHGKFRLTETGKKDAIKIVKKAKLQNESESYEERQ